MEGVLASNHVLKKLLAGDQTHDILVALAVQHERHAFPFHYTVLNTRGLLSMADNLPPPIDALPFFPKPLPNIPLTFA
jgi:hypothetical protein